MLTRFPVYFKKVPMSYSVVKSGGIITDKYFGNNAALSGNYFIYSNKFCSLEMYAESARNNILMNRNSGNNKLYS